MEMLLSDNEFKSWLELLERLVEVKQSLATVDSIVSSDHFSNEPVSVSIPTPQIAVFGDQSSGKSSLLESISGIPFPKGSGLVTRCPTMISMRCVSSDTAWSAFVSLQRGFNVEQESKPIFSKEELSERLSLAAATVASRSESPNGFSREYIHVTVSSPQLPNLTVIDLPGIIRTTTSGQSRSVIREVDDLLEEYLKQPDTIILAVIPANQDISTIDILERASTFDPSGRRTIGVLTKPDLVDRGAEGEVVQIIRNIRKPLALGYVLVKGRSQYELNQISKDSGISSTCGTAEEEEEYFSNHPVWGSQVDANNRGRKALCRRLTSLIVSRATANAPRIKASLQQALNLVENGLTVLGSGVPSSTGVNAEEEQRKWLMRTIGRFTQTLRQVAAGDYTRDPVARDPAMRLKFLVNTILSELRTSISKKVPDFDSEAYAEKLSKNVAEMRGRELPGFGSTRLLLSSVSTELLQWREFVEEALLQMGDCMIDCAEFLAEKISAGCSRLLMELVDSVRENVRLQLQAIQKRLDDIFSRGLESAATDKELVRSIEHLRQNRFDDALREALAIASDPGGGGTVSATSKHSLKIHILNMVGHAYMQQHSLIAGPNYKLEDARVAIKSYWRMSESRLIEDITSVIDQLLLTRCGESIEADLLGKAQQWIAAFAVPDSGEGSILTLQDILSEDPQLFAKRRALQKAKADCQRIMKQLQSKIDEQR